MQTLGRPDYLLKLAWESRNIPPGKWPKLLVLLLKSLLSVPLGAWEAWRYGYAIRETPIPQGPVFILGHYRSGTTWLHKVLAADPQWACIRNFDLLFPFYPPAAEKPIKPVLQRLLSGAGLTQWGFNGVPYSLDGPSEDDIFAIHLFSPVSAYWAYLFPQRAEALLNQAIRLEDADRAQDWREAYLYLIRKLTRKYEGKPLLLRSPPHTGRVPVLLKMFPRARFLFIYRNPYRVFFSMKALWKNTIRKYYCLQPIEDKAVERVVFSHYLTLHHRYERFKELIPPGCLAELRYEDFEHRPVAAAREIYDTLGLKGTEEGFRAMQQQVDKEAAYQTFTYAYEEETMEKIYKHWGHFIEKWQYKKPVS